MINSVSLIINQTIKIESYDNHFSISILDKKKELIDYKDIDIILIKSLEDFNKYESLASSSFSGSGIYSFKERTIGNKVSENILEFISKNIEFILEYYEFKNDPNNS